MQLRIMIPALTLVILAVIYGLVASRYYRVFLPGTRINGVNVSGLTVAKAEKKLIEAAEADYDLTLTFRGGESESIKGSEVDLSVSFSGEISDAMKEQKIFSWLPRLFGKGRVEEKAAGLRLYDAAKLSAWLKSLSPMQADKMTAPTNAGMAFGDDGLLTVRAEKQGTALDFDVTLEAAENAIAGGTEQLELDAVEGAYVQPAVLQDNEELLAAIDRANHYLKTKLTYTLTGDREVTVDAQVIKGWLSEKEDYPGWYYMDQNSLMNGVTEYVNELADTYNAYYDYYDFQSTGQGLVTLPVNSGSYGYIINRSAEADALFRDVIAGTEDTRVPVYSVATSLDGGIGGTYVEVDTIMQKVYLYIDGVCTLTTDCVTGLATDPNRVTPSGVYTMYDMETNRTLEGTVEEETGKPEYSSLVNYWMPFYGGYGLHDASWRYAFGGSIYQTSGSHGCVNLPIQAAATIYQSVTVGTPVVVI